MAWLGVGEEGDGLGPGAPAHGHGRADHGIGRAEDGRAVQGVWLAPDGEGQGEPSPAICSDGTGTRRNAAGGAGKAAGREATGCRQGGWRSNASPSEGDGSLRPGWAMVRRARDGLGEA